MPVMLHRAEGDVGVGVKRRGRISVRGEAVPVPSRSMWSERRRSAPQGWCGRPLAPRVRPGDLEVAEARRTSSTTLASIRDPSQWDSAVRTVAINHSSR